MSTRPPFGDATDEAVSAYLDGELDDFAAAHGITLDEVRAALHAWPGFDPRRHELEHARRALATTTAPLDPSERRRLVQRAVIAADAGRSRGRRPVWRVAAIAAAVVVVLGAAGFGLSQLGGGNRASSKSASVAGPSIPANAYVGDVGEVANTTVLRTLLTQQQAGLPLHAPDDTLTAAAGSSPTRAPFGAAAPPSTTTPAQGDAARAGAERCARTVAATDPVTFLATATYGNRAAVIAGVHRGARTVAFVLDRTTCAVITAESL